MKRAPAPTADLESYHCLAQNMTRPRILSLVDYYLPGYKAGGPVRTLANMVSELSDDFEFLIITRDRDQGDSRPYNDLTLGAWTTVGRANVFYLSTTRLSAFQLLKLLRETQYDLLYMNSFFSGFFTIPALVFRCLGLFKQRPLVIAPRGEFSPAALKLKKNKKQTYMKLAKSLNLYRNVIWQASSTDEKHLIEANYPSFLKETNEIQIVVAPDLLPRQSKQPSVRNYSRRVGPLRIVFLSRIAPMKNLDFLLRVLCRVSEPLQLSIYGPHEDPSYFALCKKLIESTPNNIEIKIHGEVNHDYVGKVLADHDLFALPSRGENFGHVVYEALAVGTPVLVSDRTPWIGDENGSLTVLALEEQLWVDSLETWVRMSDERLLRMREAASNLAMRKLSEGSALSSNRALFRQALDRNAK